MSRGGVLRFIVNVDPAGPPGCGEYLIADTVDAIYTHAPGGSVTEIKVNTPATAHFPTAFKWAWSQARAPLVFHLEDDWQLLRPVDLHQMADIMDQLPELASLRLSFFTAEVTRLKNWNRFFPWDARGFFVCPPELTKSCGFCGHPALIRGDFVREAARLIDIRWNPEKQFHHWNHPLIRYSAGFRYGVFAEQGSRPIIRDTGRTWMKSNGLKKQGIKAFFTEWEHDRD